MAVTYTIGRIITSLAFVFASCNVIWAFVRKRKIKSTPVFAAIILALLLLSLEVHVAFEGENNMSQKPITPPMWTTSAFSAYNEGYGRGSSIGIDLGFDEGFNSGYETAYNEAYKKGYEKAIEDASLVSIKEDGCYLISFNGEEHMYHKNNTTTAIIKGGVK